MRKEAGKEQLKRWQITDGPDTKLTHFALRLSRHDLHILVGQLIGHSMLKKHLVTVNVYIMTHYAQVVFLRGRGGNILYFPGLGNMLCHYDDALAHYGVLGYIQQLDTLCEVTPSNLYFGLRKPRLDFSDLIVYIGDAPCVEPMTVSALSSPLVTGHREGKTDKVSHAY